MAVRFSLPVLGAIALLGYSPLSAAEYVKSPGGQRGGYSQAVVTDAGGKIIWLAGFTPTHDSANFETQVRETFTNMQAVLVKQHANLSDVVTMTAFIKDARYRDTFTKVRKEFFKDNFPASAQITVSGFAGGPDQMVEVQAVAVVK